MNASTGTDRVASRTEHMSRRQSQTTREYSTEKRIRVMVADDHTVLREGLAALISNNEDMTVVAEAGDGRQAIELYREHRPDVLVMDLKMPVVNGVSAIRTICDEFPSARILVLSAFDGDEDIYRSLQAGATGFLVKDSSRDDLMDAIRLVSKGKTLLKGPIAEKLASRIHCADLTHREMEVLQQVAEGKSNLEIGNQLFISEGTVKAHINSILSKLGVQDRTQAVIAAVRRGIIHYE